MGLLKEITKDEQTNILAQYLPNNNVYCKKNDPDSNLRKVLIGLACVWLGERQVINQLFDEYDPSTTTDFISEWEGFVGIPDDCFGNVGNLEERRENILLKLAGTNATTAKQFENIAEILGFTVSVSSGIEFATLPLTLPFLLLGEGELGYIIVVTIDEALKPEGFPLTLPFTLTDPFPEILECLFNKLKPCNTKVILRYA